MKQKKWMAKWIVSGVMAVSGLAMGMGTIAIADADERTATIMVVSITGNELTYYEVEENEEETENATEESNSEEESESKPERSIQEKSETDLESTQESEEGTKRERMMQGDQGEGQMPSPDGMPQKDGSMKQSGNFGKSGKDENSDRSGNFNTKTVYLPVPVVVHTDTDETRTFSILEAGDRLQVTIVTDEEGKETITEIWMLRE